MNALYATILRKRSLLSSPKPQLTPSLSFLHTRSLSPYRDKPITWNTTHTFVLSNPLLSLLEKRCKSIAHLKQIQAQMISTGLISDRLALSRLIAFSALSESSDLEYCTMILYNSKNTNVFSWNVTIRGYIESQNPNKCLVLYKKMLEKSNGLRPDNYTYPLLFKVCANLGLLYMGREILGHVLKMGFDGDLFVRNAIIHMLVSCGEMVDACKMFDESPLRDLVSWNSLINGYVRGGRPKDALCVYRQMEAEGVCADEVTMIGMVSAIAQLEDLNLGREFHLKIKEDGLTLTVPLSNALMDMYVKCGDLESARLIFDKMVKRTVVSWTTMVVGYAKFGFLDAAHRFFDDMPEKDVVPWNALIGGYVEANLSKEALALLHEMQANGIKPDEVTMVTCLSGCSQLGALDVGIWIHHYIERYRLSLNVALGTALVDMYAKCGNIARALRVFWDMPAKNSKTWTAMICGLALHGKAQDAISFFLEMINSGLTPDEVTFLGVLSACCHGGLVDAGRKFFHQMSSEFNLFPSVKHYSCMVDLLGRAGLLEEAEELVTSMPIKADATVWGALFFACRVNGNVILGERVASELLKLDPDDSGIYVLLANMYGEANMWEEAGQARKMMKERGVEKTPGCSSIEVNGVVNEFIVRDKSHPMAEQIYECLALLARQMDLVEGASGASYLQNQFIFVSELTPTC